MNFEPFYTSVLRSVLTASTVVCIVVFGTELDFAHQRAVSLHWLEAVAYAVSLSGLWLAYFFRKKSAGIVIVFALLPAAVSWFATAEFRASVILPPTLGVMVVLSWRQLLTRFALADHYRRFEEIFPGAAIAQLRPEQLTTGQFAADVTVVRITLRELASHLQSDKADSIAKCTTMLTTIIRQTVAELGGMQLALSHDSFTIAFGLHPNPQVDTSKHADRALYAARTILAQYLRLTARNTPTPPILLATGLVTVPAHLCCINTDERLMTTLVHSAEHLLQRLCRASDVAAIALAESTAKSLKTIDPEVCSTVELPGQGRHRKVTAYLYHLPDIGLDLQALKTATTSVKDRPRTKLSGGSVLEFSTNFGPLKIIDISKGGLSFASKTSFDIGDSISASITSEVNDIADFFASKEISTLELEIRWYRESEQVMTYGAKFVNMAPQDGEDLITLISESQAGSRAA